MHVNNETGMEPVSIEEESSADSLNDENILSTGVEAESNELGVEDNVDVLSDGGTFNDLKKKFSDATDYVELTNDYTIANSNTITITKGLTVEGNGHTLNRNSYEYKLFIINTNSKVVFNNIVFKNFKQTLIEFTNTNGATFEFNNCTFKDFQISTTGGILGGVIKVSTKVNSGLFNKVVFDNINIKSTSTSSYSTYYLRGGAIYFSSEVSNLTFNNTVFDNIKMTGSTYRNYYNGGAIYFSSRVSNLTFNKVNFTGNSVKYSSSSELCLGGAIYYGQGPSGVRYTNCNFINNTASSKGGAIYIASNKDYTSNNNYFENVTFSGNIVEGVTSSNGLYGGSAIFFACGSYKDTFTNVTFEKNVVYGKATSERSYHGALAFTGIVHDLTFNNADFTKNSISVTISNTNVKYYGGAISFASTCDNIIYNNVNFTENSIESQGTQSNYYGGAIAYSMRARNITYSNCEFNKNYARYRGGAIYIKEESSNSVFKNVTFNENQAVFDSAGAIYFASSSTNDNFTDVVFYKNSAKNGGAIIFGNVNGLTLDNVNFTENKASSNGGSIYFGGSIQNPNMNDCTFKDNAASYGAVIYFSSKAEEITFENLDFIGNKASSQGGVIYFSSDTKNLTFENLDFINNSGSNGAVIYYNNEASNDFSNCNFIGNKASSYGGAIYARTSGIALNFNDITFENNSASSSGGAIYIGDFGSTLKFENSRFIKNQASSGGAIYAYTEKISFNEVNFTENNAKSAGAAIYATSSSEDKYNYYNFTDVNFVRNTAGSASSSANGIIYSSKNSLFRYNNVNFTDNVVYGMGVVAIGNSYYSSKYYNYDTYYNVNFINNTAKSGGAIFYSGGRKCYNTFEFVNFINNTASNSGGGAIYTGDFSNNTFRHVNFEGNGARYGGAIDYMTSQCYDTFEDVTFISNTARYNGGAIYYSVCNDVQFNNNLVFINNTAGQYGGALFCDRASNISFTNMEFINNSADVKGGAIYIYLGDAIPTPFVNTTFKNNYAYYGAAIYARGSIVIEECNFTENKAEESVIYFSDCDGNENYIYNSIFENNKGTVIGMDFYPYYAEDWEAKANVTVENCIFNENDGESVISLNNVNLYLSRSNFTNNMATGLSLSYSFSEIEFVKFVNNTGNTAGAVDLYDCTVDMYNIICENNYALESGGAFLIVGCEAYVEYVSFINNTAFDCGGAICIDESAFTINNAEFYLNTADLGGAIYIRGCLDGNKVYIESETSFANNTALCSAGAIYIGSDALAVIRSPYIVNSTAGLSGGAIFVDKSAEASIDGTFFEYNKAQKGSAIDNRGALTISNSEFLKNKAGSFLRVYYNSIRDLIEISYTLGDNYIHAISSDEPITFDNVEYFEYEDNIFNTDSVAPTESYYCENKTVTVVFYDGSGAEIERSLIKTRLDGRYELNPVSGFDLVAAFTEEDDYYEASSSQDNISKKGDFDILQELILNNTDGILDLTRDYTYTIGYDTMTEGIFIDKPIVINGNGHVIDALFKSRIFYVMSDNVVFNNVVFANASGIDGAFIFIDDVSGIEINGCNFSNPGTITLPYYLGVIQAPIDDPMLFKAMSNTYSIFLPVFKGYEYDYDGGAIYAVSNGVSIANSSFSGLAADIGGTIHYEGKNLKIANSKWYESIGLYGGAIYIDGDNIEIDNSLFNVSFAAYAGGSILASGVNYTISNSSFIYQVAFGVYHVETFVPGSVDVSSRSLKDGSGGVIVPAGQVISANIMEYGGGAININADNVNLINDVFADCISVSFGGAVYAEGRDYIIFNSTFYGCTAENSYVDEEELYSSGLTDKFAGGAIYCNVINITIDLSSFDKGYSLSGGAIFANGEDTHILNSNFTTNLALDGGAIYIGDRAANSTVINCNFKNNTAMGSGGAISWNADNGILDNSVFADNQFGIMMMFHSNMGGGAISWFGCNASISNSIFKNNSATLFKRTGYLYSSQPLYSITEFVDSVINRELFYGGALLIGGYHVNITNNTFEDNIGQTGGAISILSQHVSPSVISGGDRVVQKASPYDKEGSGSMTVDYWVIIDNCTFTNNSAIFGGAVHSGSLGGDYGDYTLITNSKFYYNTAVHAGAIFMESSYNLIENSIFEDNNAIIAGAIILGNSDCYYINEGSGGSSGGRSLSWHTITTGHNSIVNSVFNRNAAESAGAVLVMSHESTISYCNFTDNHVGNVSDVYSELLSRIYDMELLCLYEKFVYVNFKDYWNMSDFNDNLIKQGKGGAIYWNDYDGLLEYCEFTRNTAFSGGAVYSTYGVLSVSDSIFTENEALSKSEIEVFDNSYEYVVYVVTKEDVAPYEITPYSHLTLEALNEYITELDSQFKEYIRETYHVEDWDILILLQTQDVSPELGYNCLYNLTLTFVYRITYHDLAKHSGNIAYGGAICLNDVGMVSNSIFINNSADEGGAIYCNYELYEPQRYSIVEDSEFYNNTAVLGGAIYFEGDKAEVYNSTFVDNNVIRKELWDVEVETVMANNTEYEVPNVLDGVKYTFAGEFRRAYTYKIVSELYNTMGKPDVFTFSFDDETSIMFSQLDFEVTTQQEISPLYEPGGERENYTFDYIQYVYTAKYYNVHEFYNGSAEGGAIYWKGNDGSLMQSTFTNNAAENGGAVYFEGNWTYVDYSTFTDNTAENGGAIYVSGNNTELDGCNFTNQSAVYGGAIYASGANYTLYDSEFHNNTADYGGAIYASGENYTVYWSKFHNNAANYGGAIYTSANNTIIRNSEFINNSAVYSGGAIYASSPLTAAVYSNFEGNTAKYGGAIYSTGYLGIGWSEFINNKAESGSAVYSNNVEVISSVFLDNQAKSDSIEISVDVQDKNVTVIATFKGNDNLINALFVEGGFQLTDVTYWSSEYGALTNSDIANPQLTSLEDGINITFSLLNSKYSGEEFYTNVTNVAGQARLYLPNSRSGRYYLIATHYEDAYYTDLSNFYVFEVGTQQSPMEIDVNDIYYKENETVTIKLSHDAEGNVTVWLNNEFYKVDNLTNGEVSFIISGLAAGTYDISVQYNGSDRYDSSIATAQFNVKQINSTVNVTTASITDGLNVPINITVGPYDDVTGKVFVTIEDEFGVSLTVTGTQLQTSVRNLADGNYTVSVYYTGDNNYLSSTNTTNFTVVNSVAETPVYTINATIPDINYLENATAYINVSYKLNGVVVITIGNRTFSENVVNGIAVVNLDGLSGGMKTANVNFTSSNNKIKLTTATKFVVNRLPTAVDIAINGRSIVINVTEGATGILTVNINGVVQDYPYDGTPVELINKLIIGNNTIVADYNGNENYSDSQNVSHMNIPKNASLISVTADDIPFGNSALIIVHVGEGQTGYVTLTVNNTNYNQVIEDTKLMFNIPGLVVGEYPVYVKYYGDSVFREESNSTSFNVTKADLSTSATIVGLNVTVIENATFVIGVPTNFEGKLNITVDGETYSGPVQSVVTMAKLLVGDKLANATFWGDKNYADFSFDVPFKVSKLFTEVSIDVGDATYPNEVTAEITVSNKANGTLILTVNGKEYPVAQVLNGHTSIELGKLSAGIKNATVNFTVTDSINTDVNGKTRFAINQANSTVRVTAQNNDVVVSVGNGATGKLTLYVNGEKKEYYYDGNDIIWQNVMFVGNNTIITVFDGNENFTGSQNTTYIIVDKRSSLVNVTADEITYGSDAVIVVRVGEGQTGYATINVNNKEYSAEIKNGGATFTIPGLNAATYSVSVNYTGDINFNGNTNHTDLIVKKADLNVAVTGQNVTVNDNASFVIEGVPSDFKGFVNITVDGITYSGSPSSLVKMAKLTSGDKVADVVFYGDSNYNNLTLTAPFTVSRVSSTSITVLTVSVDNVVYPNEAIAVINISGKANGTVIVTVNGKEYPVENVENGYATVNLGTLSAGVKDVIAKFTVSDKININTTGATKFAVDKAAGEVKITVSGTSAIINVTKGTDANLTVYVNGVKEELFYSGDVITLNNVLVGGNNTIIAIYDGNDNYTESKDTVTQRIDKKSSSIEVSAETITYGSDAIIIVNVGANQTGHVTINVNGTDYTSQINANEIVFTIPGLNAGKYTVDASYAGDINYESSSDSTTLIVNQAKLNAVVTGQNITVNDNASFIIDGVTSDFKGVVNITVDGTTYSGNVSSLIKMGKLTSGDKVADVVFYGDSNYKVVTLTAPFTVSRVSVSVVTTATVTVKDVAYPEGATAAVRVSGKANGTVIITVNGKEYPAVQVINGIADVDLGTLASGLKNITAKFIVSDLINNNVTATNKFTVAKANTSTEITFDGANVIVNVSPDVAGKLSVYINGIENIFTYKGQTITIKNALVTGENSVLAIYDGNENYTGSQDAKNLTIPKKESLVIVSARDITYGSVELIEVTVPSAQTGYVSISVDGTNYTTAVKNGKATFVIAGLNASEYKVAVTYVGDENYEANVNKTSFAVKKADLPATVIGQDITTVDNSSFVVSVPDDFTGIVEISVDGNVYSGPVNSLITMAKLTEGDKVASVKFSNDPNYNDLRLNAPFKVSPIAELIEILTIKADDMTRGWNSEYDYQAAFLDNEGKALVNVWVKFRVNGQTYTARTNEDGIAHLTSARLDVGTHKITSINTVTGQEITKTVKIVPRITENKDGVMDFYSGKYFVVKVTGDDGENAPEGEIVSIYANGVYYVAKVDDKGYARLKINLNPTKYKMVAEYKSYRTVNKLIVKQTLKLVKKTISYKKGKKLVLKARLKWSNGKPIKKKVIKFKFRFKTFKVRTDSKGIAKVTISNKIIKKLRKGKTYPYIVAYRTNILKGKVKVK